MLGIYKHCGKSHWSTWVEYHKGRGPLLDRSGLTYSEAWSRVRTVGHDAEEQGAELYQCGIWWTPPGEEIVVQ